MSRILQVVEAVKAAREAKKRIDFPTRPGVTFFSGQDIWLYDPREDTITCDMCRSYAELASAMGGLNGNFIRALFPYLVILDENTIGGPGTGGRGLSHPNCVPEGTLVTTIAGKVPIETIKIGDLVLTHKGRFRPVIQLHRSKFEGKLYSINGDLLTPNHPVLTLHGWVSPDRFNSLVENVFYLNLIDMKSKNLPSMTKKIPFLSHIIPSFLFRTVPVAPINFDCEFFVGNSKVNVKNINSIFRNNNDFSLLKRFKKQLLKLAKSSFFLNTLRAFHQKLMCFLFAPHTIMGGFNLPFSLFYCHLTPLQSFRLTLISNMNVSFNKTFPDCCSGHPKSFSNSILGQTTSIKFDDFFNRQLNSRRQLSTSTIKNIYILPYKGVVCNLSVYEDESYTVGNRGLIVHNCRCFLRRYIGDPADSIPAQKALVPDKLKPDTLDKDVKKSAGDAL